MTFGQSRPRKAKTTQTAYRRAKKNGVKFVRMNRHLPRRSKTAQGRFTRTGLTQRHHGFLAVAYASTMKNTMRRARATDKQR